MRTFIKTLVLFLALSAGDLCGQTRLFVNGQWSSDNSLIVNVPTGASMHITIQHPQGSGRPYGLFGSLARTINNNGWYLTDNGVKDPFAVFTGIDTDDVVTAFGTPITPARPGSPNIRLNSSGSASLSFFIPANFTPGTYYLQAVVDSAFSGNLEESNGVRIDITAATESARLLVSTGADHGTVGFGVLEFSNGPGSGIYVPHPSLNGIDVYDIGLTTINQWTDNSIDPTGVGNPETQDRARSVDLYMDDRPVLNNDNHRFARISLPSAPGGVPPRDLLRIFNGTETSFMIINKGDNPNIPNVDYHEIVNARLPGADAWRPNVALNSDGTRMLATTSDFLQIFLIATDGDTPFNNGTTDVVDITPQDIIVTAIQEKAPIFTDSNCFFVALDDSPAPLYFLYTSIINGTPASNQVCDSSNPPICAFGHIAEFSTMAAEDGNVMVFLAGTSLTTNPDRIDDGEWYSVFDSNTALYNPLTAFAASGAATSQLVPGTEGSYAYNGINGFAAVSPDGSKLGLVSRNSREDSLADEVYIARTDGADFAIGDLIDRPVTTSARVNTAANPTLNQPKDLQMPDADTLLFSYGSISAGDLFHYDTSTDTFTNLSATGDATAGQVGTIVAEGVFSAPGDSYLFYSLSRQGIPDRANIAGVDLNGVSLFNVTGNDFAGASQVNTANAGAAGDNFLFHMVYAGGPAGSLTFFSAPVEATSFDQIWVFDADFPSIAFAVTNELTPNFEVESLTPNPYQLGAAFAGAIPNLANADVEYMDVVRGLRDNLSGSGYSSGFALGTIAFVPPGNTDDPRPTGLVYALGSSGGNPSDADFFYVSLEGNANEVSTPIANSPTGALQVYYTSFE